MRGLSFLLAGLIVAAATPLAAQTLTLLKNAPPADGIQYGYVMTDGTVLLQGGGGSDWYRLTPDASGNYVNATWSSVESLPASYAPSATSGAVLPDGRVLVTGGEYLFGANFQQDFALSTKSAVYDPVSGHWTVFNGPKGWVDIGDSPGTMLPRGQFLLGEKTTRSLALLDAKTLTWTVLKSAGKVDENAEEGFTLLPDGSVLTDDVSDAPHSELLNTATFIWKSLGSTKANLKFTWTGGNAAPIPWVYGGKTYYYKPAGEIGPAILRPDGTVFATGGINTVPALAAHAHTAIYTPAAAAGAAGTWRRGPDFLSGDDAGDQFGVLLPNGHVLVEANIGGGDHDRRTRAAIFHRNWLNHIPYAPTISNADITAALPPAGCTGSLPLHLYEFDGTHFTRQRLGMNACGISVNLLVLPNGQTLVGGFAVYDSPGAPQTSWAPAVSAVSKTLARGTTAKLTGTQLTGLSQANAFGDEFAAPTNYPLVRLTNTATQHVIYCRTHDWTNAGVATGTLPVSTQFDIPAAAEPGAFTLEVVTNGIASSPVSVTVR